MRGPLASPYIRSGRATRTMTLRAPAPRWTGPVWIAACRSRVVSRSRVRLGPTAVLRPGSGLQDGAGGDEAGLDIAPQGDQELPRQGHDRDPPDPALGAADPGREPPAEPALRLEAHPQPGELDHHAPDPRVAGLAHALVAAAVAARERARRQAGVGRHAAPVRDRAVEDLRTQDRRALRAQALEAQQRRRLARRRGRRPVALGLDLREHLERQAAQRWPA